MTKKELINAISEHSGLSEEQSRVALDAIIKAIGNDLSKLRKVRFRGFGTFSVVRRGERSGRNFQTGKVFNIGPKNTISFKASNNLKNKLNKGGGTDGTGPRKK